MREIERILRDMRTLKEFLNSCRSDDGIVCILKGIYGIETTKGEVYGFFAQKYNQIYFVTCFTHFSHTDDIIKDIDDIIKLSEDI